MGQSDPQDGEDVRHHPGFQQSPEEGPEQRHGEVHPGGAAGVVPGKNNSWRQTGGQRGDGETIKGQRNPHQLSAGTLGSS